MPGDYPTLGRLHVICWGVSLMYETAVPGQAGRADVLIAESHPWRRRVEDWGTVHTAGDASVPERIMPGSVRSRKRLSRLLLTQGSQFATVVQTSDTIFACVDAVRSFPLFHATTATGFTLTTNPRRLLPLIEGTLDDTSLLEMYHAGYVTGHNTLYREITQLEAGTALLFDARTGELTSWAYHEYRPQLRGSEVASTLSPWIEELGAILDHCFERVIERVGDRAVYIPLSGGLDSRLVACKLHELGFTRIKAFTYGPPGNSQSLVAARVAEVLGLDWCEIPFDVKRMREIFHSEQRARYQQFADGLSTLPSMGEFCPLIQLDCERPDEVVVINGQSGDFICGNHLPAHLVGATDNRRLWEHIRSKHFGVRPRGTADLQPIEERFCSWSESTAVGDKLEHPSATRHENWEFRERQAKYVVNGQRIYEYLGMDWLLPWWDFELVRFFESVPLRGYVNRRLLLEYLRDYDYMGLFTERFQTARAFAGPEGRLWEGGLRSLGSLGRVPEVARRMAYYRCGYYRSYFALYPFDEYMRRSRGTVVDPQARCATGLMIDQWFEDQGLSQEAMAGGHNGAGPNGT